MHTFTAVIPALSILPHDLALLLAPIRAREPSDPDGYAGQSEGVVLDEDERVVAFIVRLSPRLAPTRPRTLMAASAVTVTDDSVLNLSWTEAQLLAQPRLDDALRDEGPSDGGAALEGESTAPYSEAAKETLKEGAGGVAIGAVVGAIAGLAAGGPIALSLAAFFALGGGLVGVISGATHPTDAEADAEDLVTLEPGRAESSAAALQKLGERLRDPAMRTGDLVQMMRFSRASATVALPEAEAPPERQSQPG